MHQTAKTTTALARSRSEPGADVPTDDCGGLRFNPRCGRWRVAIDEGPDSAFKMVLVQDQQPVEALGPHRAYEARATRTNRLGRMSSAQTPANHPCQRHGTSHGGVDRATDD
jgi:hypothetical protein